MSDRQPADERDEGAGIAAVHTQPEPGLDPGVGPPVWRLPTCPKCESSDLEPVTDGESINFLCASCGRCWHFELNWARRVDPATCTGCIHRETCRALHDADHAIGPVVGANS